MKIDSFIKAKELYMSGNLNEQEHVKLHDFFDKKYGKTALVEEGIIDWIKRNWSPTAIKLQKMGKDYYDWLLREYRSNYRKKDFNDLDNFLKRISITDDLEEQIVIVAGDNPLYLKLAKTIVLKNRIAAKKDFVSELLGPNNVKTQKLEKEFEEAKSEEQTANDNAQPKDVAEITKETVDILTKVDDELCITAVREYVWQVCVNYNPSKLSNHDPVLKHEIEEPEQNILEDAHNADFDKHVESMSKYVNKTEKLNSKKFPTAIDFNTKKVSDAAKNLKLDYDYVIAECVKKHDLDIADQRTAKLITSISFVKKIFALKFGDEKRVREKLLKPVEQLIKKLI